MTFARLRLDSHRWALRVVSVFASSAARSNGVVRQSPASSWQSAVNVGRASLLLHACFLSLLGCFTRSCCCGFWSRWHVLGQKLKLKRSPFLCTRVFVLFCHHPPSCCGELNSSGCKFQTCTRPRGVTPELAKNKGKLYIYNGRSAAGKKVKGRKGRGGC